MSESASRRGTRRATVASFALLVVEALGTVLLWVPIPVVWFWIGARVYNVTHSILADGIVVLAGFLVTSIFVLQVLTRIDSVWISLRRRAGHEQRDGALNQVVVASATFGLVGFWIWFHIIEKGFVIRFMPTD